MFRIDADHLGWINTGKDDREDLCLHGRAVVCIGERTLEYYATVSATALYLLKTLTEDLNEYRKEVLQFADKIETFYQSSLPKILPEDEFECNGYLAFWNEWHRRRKL